MKIDFTQPLKTFDGKNIKAQDGNNILMKQLMLDVVGSYKAKTGEEAIKAYHLGIKVSTYAELKAHDVVLLKKIMDEAQLPTISKGQILELLQDK